MDLNQRESASQYANADKVLYDIDQGIVFDDILIEYDQLYIKSLEELGYDVESINEGV